MSSKWSWDGGGLAVDAMRAAWVRRRLFRNEYHVELEKVWRFQSSLSRQTSRSLRETKCSLGRY